MEQGFPLFSFFTDPILRAPTLGCMLMSLSASLVGVIVFLRKESLVGETLSHAAYPGVILGILATGSLGFSAVEEWSLAIFTLIGAFLTALGGFWSVQFLQKRMHVSSDAALCFVLSTFFGVGLLLASEVQFSYTSLYKQALTYFYGQAATMTDIHIVIYGVLSLVVIFLIFLFYKEWQVMTFDRQYAESLGISVRPLDALLLIVATLAVIIGIRSVGVVLMSAMLIAPVVAARQFTHRLSVLFLLAGIFGLACGFLGNYFSVHLSFLLKAAYPSKRIALPTGPVIVLVAACLACLSLLFAERGLIVRLCRMARFRDRCTFENLLKTIWRIHPDAAVSLNAIQKYQSFSQPYLKFFLWRMKRKGWIAKLGKNEYRLTSEGRKRAAQIVRFHRLWEVYLTNYLGVGGERVHRNAEEMEHIITPELEGELTILLNNPREDPHRQPIPPKERNHEH